MSKVVRNCRRNTENCQCGW